MTAHLLKNSSKVPNFQERNPDVHSEVGQVAYTHF